MEEAAGVEEVQDLQDLPGDPEEGFGPLRPAPGEEVQASHEVVGEEPAVRAAPAGRDQAEVMYLRDRGVAEARKGEDLFR